MKHTELVRSTKPKHPQGCLTGIYHPALTMAGKKIGGERMTLAERMIQYRARERINQKELAERCGLSLQTVNSVENETQAPSKITMAKIELVIGQERIDKEGI